MDKTDFMQYMLGIVMLSFSVILDSTEMAIFGATIVISVKLSSLENSIKDKV